MFEIKRYTSADKEKWNAFVSKAKNATFLFYRDYMDYHADRFSDYSLMVFRKNKLFALLPANNIDNALYSHQGLSYGGLILDSKATVEDVLSVFNQINTFLKQNNIFQVIYKAIPYIYHILPSQEDLYALFILKAQLVERNISSSIIQKNAICFTESRKSGLRKALAKGVIIQESEDYASFWAILSENLNNRYNTKPVHSLDEILLLKSRFVTNIKLYVAIYNGIVVAGTVVYITSQVVHTQYISASSLGKEIGALDILFDKLINETFKAVTYFDFGQSTEQHGVYLNKSLIFQKEGFGGRGVVYDIYKYNIE